jgi:hypothetical protein
MLIHSLRESQLFNVKFGRYEGEADNLHDLATQIKEQQFDFVRMKIVGGDANLFMQMNALGFPYHLLDIHRYYWRDFEETPAVAPVASNMVLQRNEGQLTREIEEMVLHSFDENPMGYFRNEELEKYFPVHLQRQNVAEYISQNYKDTTNPGRQCWLIKIDGVNAGCGSTDFKPGEAYTTYIGLLPPYRKRSYYTEVIARMQYEIQQAGARYCTGSARLHNLSSQSVFERQHERYLRHDYVFMLMPRLSMVI